MQAVSLEKIKKTGDKIIATINYTDVVIKFNYIEREDYWTMDLYETLNDAKPFLAGIKCNLNDDLLRPFRGIYDKVPIASLQFTSNDSNKQTITGDDMAQGKVIMVILLPEELT